MKFISWNVNGIRAAVKKGFEDFFKEADADIFFFFFSIVLSDGISYVFLVTQSALQTS